MHSRLVLALLGTALAGCGSKDNVALSGSISNVQIALEEVTLGTRLSGGFSVRLELGAQAPDRAELSLGSFSLLDADQSEIAALQVLDANQVFPLELKPGQSRSAELVLDDANPVSADRTSLCRSLRVAGFVTDDAAAGELTSLTSPAFTIQGC